MLTTLSIRDVVLIERLDLAFARGLTVLTGETGAGKSILLDSLGLALGARAETGLVRAGAEQALVAAVFEVPTGHPALATLREQGLDTAEELVLRRVVSRDGRSRAFANDQPISVALLRRLGAELVEVQGQHEQMGLADPASHAGFLDAHGVGPGLREAVATAWRDWRATRERLSAARAAIETARRDEEWLRHAVEELAKLAPMPEEEDRLAAERLRLQRDEQRAEAIAASLAELTPRDRRSSGPAAALRAASRALRRLIPQGAALEPDNPVVAAMAGLERAEEALAEAETLLARIAHDSDTDPRLLERLEERLFALRAAARKHAVSVADLPGLLDRLAERLAGLESGEAEVAALEQAERDARAGFLSGAEALSAARQAGARALEAAVNAELPPLRLEKARFFAEVEALAETAWGADGTDSVRFLIATNPGQPPGPLGRIASGGELSRLMLALKVVMARGSTVPTLVFDEVDSGIGGATAASVGDRLERVARDLQVLVVTHSPQVAARGMAHLRVAKQVTGDRAATVVDSLAAAERLEEIARMLAGETVTEAARSAAAALFAPERGGA
jgi:DNA repair protein RecN (Recombination protein N)